MSVEQDISDLIQAATGAQDGPAAEAVARAVKEVGTLFTATGDSFADICFAIECASTQPVLRVAFERLDKIMRIFYGVVPGTDNGNLICDAIMSFQLSERLLGFFESATAPREAITDYKKAILGDLVSSRQREKTQASLDNDINDHLFEQFFSASGRSAPAVAQKRVGSSVFDEQLFSPIPKKRSRIPALAALQQFPVDSESTGAVKKNVLIPVRSSEQVSITRRAS